MSEEEQKQAPKEAVYRVQRYLSLMGHAEKDIERYLEGAKYAEPFDFLGHGSPKEIEADFLGFMEEA